MIPKNERSKFLQNEIDERRTRISYNFITEYKGVDSTVKLLLNEMCNDIFMNGFVTWKHQTYADHIGITRRQVLRWFERLIEIGILKPEKLNKIGGKSNRFKLDVDPKLIKKLSEPVTSKVKTCDTQGIEPVTPKVKTCDIDGTYNKPNKSNKDLLGKEESFGDSSSQPEGPQNPVIPENWLDLVNIK